MRDHGFMYINHQIARTISLSPISMSRAIERPSVGTKFNNVTLNFRSTVSQEVRPIDQIQVTHIFPRYFRRGHVGADELCNFDVVSCGPPCIVQPPPSTFHEAVRVKTKQDHPQHTPQRRTGRIRDDQPSKDWNRSHKIPPVRLQAGHPGKTARPARDKSHPKPDVCDKARIDCHREETHGVRLTRALQLSASHARCGEVETDHNSRAPPCTRESIYGEGRLGKLIGEIDDLT